MRNAHVLVVVLLTLGTLMAVPGFATDSNPQATVDLLEAETVLETPAEAPALDDLFGDTLRTNAIRTCTEQEELMCPPQCGCVFVSNMVRCVGSDPVCQAHGD